MMKRLIGFAVLVLVISYWLDTPPVVTGLVIIAVGVMTVIAVAIAIWKKRRRRREEEQAEGDALIDDLADAYEKAQRRERPIEHLGTDSDHDRLRIEWTDATETTVSRCWIRDVNPSNGEIRAKEDWWIDLHEYKAQAILAFLQQYEDPTVIGDILEIALKDTKAAWRLNRREGLIRTGRVDLVLDPSRTLPLWGTIRIGPLAGRKIEELSQKEAAEWAAMVRKTETDPVLLELDARSVQTVAGSAAMYRATKADREHGTDQQ